MIQHMREDPSRTEAQNALVSCNKPVRVKLKDPRDPAAWTRPCCFARLAFAPDAIVLANAASSALPFLYCISALPLVSFYPLVRVLKGRQLYLGASCEAAAPRSLFAPAKGNIFRLLYADVDNIFKC